jgi:hypothetical protein
MAIGKARKIGKFIEDEKLPDGGKFIPADIVISYILIMYFFRSILAFQLTIE